MTENMQVYDVQSRQAVVVRCCLKESPRKRKMNCPKLCVQHKKPLWHIKLSNELASQFKRSQFCFELNTLMIVKVNVIINHSSSFLKGRYLCPVNALCFENREEIFSQSIIIRIATS